MKKKYIPLILIVFTLFSCMSVTLRTFLAEPGVILYFMPPTKWTAKGSNAELDITWRSNSDTPAVVNISFFGKKEMPRAVTVFSLNGANVEYPLEFETTIYKDQKAKEYRVSMHGDRTALFDLLKDDSITLKAEVDGIEYIYKPKKDFIVLKDMFLNNQL